MQAFNQDQFESGIQKSTNTIDSANRTHGVDTSASNYEHGDGKSPGELHDLMFGSDNEEEWEAASEVPPSPSSEEREPRKLEFNEELGDMSPRVTFPSLRSEDTDSDDPPHLRLAHSDPPRYLQKPTKTYGDSLRKSGLAFMDPRSQDRVEVVNAPTIVAEAILQELRQTRTQMQEQMEMMKQRMYAYEQQQAPLLVPLVS